MSKAKSALTVPNRNLWLNAGSKGRSPPRSLEGTIVADNVPPAAPKFPSRLPLSNWRLWHLVSKVAFADRLSR